MTSNDDTLQRLLALDHRGLDVLQEMASVLGEMQRTLRELTHQNHQLQLLATTDFLTGLANRRGFEEELFREEARARRERTPAAVITFDVRKLKAVNDTYGHSAGDALLQSVARSLQDTARQSDVVARLGGDEFAALLPGANRAGAEVFLERVRVSVSALRLPSGDTVSVQLAAGIAAREEGESLQEALRLADSRLLLDKQRSHA